MAGVRDVQAVAAAGHDSGGAEGAEGAHAAGGAGGGDVEVAAAAGGGAQGRDEAAVEEPGLRGPAVAQEGEEGAEGREAAGAVAQAGAAGGAKPGDPRPCSFGEPCVGAATMCVWVVGLGRRPRKSDAELSSISCHYTTCR